MSLDAQLQVQVDGFRLEASLQVGDGEVVGLLGPNGAGKTTALRAIAGLVPLVGGHVELAGRSLEDPAAGLRRIAADRGIAVVFQEHRLFPHLSLRDNVAFGLRARGLARAEADARALVWLDRMGLAERASDRPGHLSGGQAQRVALARALACEPAALLLDEPLAALDVETRQRLRAELRRHLDEVAVPTLLVTHDPVEALGLCDRLVILEEGRVVQDARPAEVVSRPRSAWAAELVGLNLLHGVADGTQVQVAAGVQLMVADPAHGPVELLIHPRSVALHREVPHGSPRNVLALEVGHLDVRGDHVRVVLKGEIRLVAEVTPGAVAELDLARGGTVHAAIKAVEIAAHPG